jgi:hypothetical protein
VCVVGGGGGGRVGGGWGWMPLELEFMLRTNSSLAQVSLNVNHIWIGVMIIFFQVIGVGHITHFLIFYLRLYSASLSCHVLLNLFKIRV